VSIDSDPVTGVTRAVLERLAEARTDRDRGRRQRLHDADERQFARQVIAGELDRLARERLAAGLDPMDLDAERVVMEAVLANAMGLGGLQPHLDDHEIQDIHVRGAESTWLKRRDGSRCEAAPVVDTDDELVDLVRLVAARMGRSERRFDAASPSSTSSYPTALDSSPSWTYRRGQAS
jgi:pilus assembly protein CpaF